MDGHGRPLALLVAGGQRNDGAGLEQVLEKILVPRRGTGRPRTRPQAVIADRAYSTKVICAGLRRRGIRTVIPEKVDTIAARDRRGSRSGRPPGFDAQAYVERNVVERFFAKVKRWSALATRYDKHALNYRAGATLFAIITWLRA